MLWSRSEEQYTALLGASNVFVVYAFDTGLEIEVVLF